ncbi:MULTISPECIES: hypothetical protein [unclassified Caballeronia]|uniref:hypothetical protein n=1 Tax=unclassified Caballeronia TaxID=2646786 RepID=UPI0020287EB5|nr:MULTISPECIES: hypothetical protein [unclassified Caballeronia]MDR5785113.1 hypothetical protein [Caballeronia sp. LP003]
MDLREIQRLHAQFAPDSMTIDLPRQIAALPAPADLTADAKTPTLKLRLPKAVPVARRTVVTVAIAAVVAMAGMGAASLYKSVGAPSAPELKKTADFPRPNASERPAIEGPAVAEATRPIDAEPPHPVVLAPMLTGKDVATASPIGLTADQFKNSLGTTSGPAASGPAASATANKAVPPVSNDEQRAAASPIHQTRRESEAASQAPTRPVASAPPAQATAQPTAEEQSSQQHAAPTRAHSYRHRPHSRDEQASDGDTGSAASKKSAPANRGGANEVQMF